MRRAQLIPSAQPGTEAGGTQAATDAARDAAAVLESWSAMAQGAFAANTLRAWQADWGVFAAFCAQRRLTALPAAALTVRDFVFASITARKRPATIRRYVATIGRVHRAAEVPDPTAAEVVRLALREMARMLPARQQQARGLVWREIEQYLQFGMRNLRDVRDRALVAVAYDTLCRREELVNLQIEDVAQAADGAGTILIRRSKTDPAGEGAIAYLAPLTMRLLFAWLQAARLGAGPVFRRVLGRGRVGSALTAQNVTAIFRKVGRWIGLPPAEWGKLSGHSVRVGAAQDLLALNVDLPSVMQAGRWKDTRMPMRYGEKLLASRSAMARAAKEQGRA